MKYSILLAISLFFYFSTASAQSINKEITTGKSPYLLGKINKKGLIGEHYNGWFSKHYNTYNPDESIIADLKNNIKDYNIKLFMGTWCGDSKRQVPKFYKILEASNFPMDQLTVVAVSREANMYKQSPKHEEQGLNIHRVPTFIFYKNGKEVNRIVEKPVETLEKDIQNIIANNYTSNYYIATVVDDILKHKGAKGLKRKEKKLLKKYDNKVSSMFELNTYGRILHSTKRTEEAIAVFELNTKLFPKQPRTYMSLANTLGASGHKDKAIKVLENAIAIHPENEKLKENLQTVKSN